MKDQSFLSPQAANVLSGLSLKIFSRNEINISKWDDCIRTSLNETPMAYSWVLDFMAPNWNGLVIGNYEGVMPLNSTSYWGNKFIQMPYDIHNLDLFSPHPTLSEIKHQIFFHPVFSPYRFISYNFLSSYNIHTSKETKPFLSFRNTYELPLNEEYSTIYNNYSKSHKKNIRRFLKNNFTIEKNGDPHSYKKLQQAKAKEKKMLFTPHSHNINFSEMVQTAIQKNKGELLSISENNELIGSCFFLFGEMRTLLFHISNITGRQKNTTFGLIDHFLKSHSGQANILDFAGSDIESIASFNSGFGARHCVYPVFYRNHLPWPVKIAKEAHIGEHIKRFGANLTR
jgi:hypothetical protein